MKKATLNGILIGSVISVSLLALCYFTLSWGARPCIPGVGFTITPFVFAISLITALCLLKSKAVLIRSMAKAILVIMGLALIAVIIIIKTF